MSNHQLDIQQTIERVLEDLSHTPRERWELVLAIIEKQATEQDAPVIFRIVSQAANLSPDIMKAPKSWIRSLLAGNSNPWLGLARTLDLRKMHLGNDEVRLLASCAAISGVVRIRLYMNMLGSAGTQALANSPYLNNLEALSLTFNRVGSAEAAVLVNSAKLPNLRQLYLGRNRIGDQGAIAIANSPLAQRFEVLHLHENNLTEIGKNAILNSPFLENCKNTILNNFWLVMECHI